MFRPLATTFLRTNTRSTLLLKRNASDAADLKDLKKWRWISIASFVPMIVVPPILNYMEPEDHSPPEFREYTHLRIRTRPFPFGDGDKSLLHNPQVNPIPSAGGYEEEFVPHH